MYLGQAFCARGILHCDGRQWHTNSVVWEKRAMDEIWRAVSARWGRPTQGFGRCHLGPSGSQFSLTGWGARGGPHASGFGFYFGTEEFEMCQILLNV